MINVYLASLLGQQTALLLETEESRYGLVSCSTESNFYRVPKRDLDMFESEVKSQSLPIGVADSDDVVSKLVNAIRLTEEESIVSEGREYVIAALRDERFHSK